MRGPGGRVVVVASEETAERVARAIRALGVGAEAVPWARPVPAADPEALGAALRRARADLVVLTSRNAARFLPRGAARGMRAAAVGPGTAAAARRAGFDVAVVGRAGGGALARAVAAAGPPGRALLLRGEEAGAEVAAGLRRAGWTVRAVVAYRMEPRPGFAPSLAACLPAAGWVVGSPAAAAAVRGALGARSFPPPSPGPPVVVPGATTARALARRGRVRPRRAASAAPEAVAAEVARALGRIPGARGT